MDILLVILGLFLMLLGILGSFLPVLPGPPFSWLGLLVLYLTKAIPNDWTFLGITFFIALAVFILDYIIPAMGTKRFGGSKAGIIGTMVGVLVAIIAFPIFTIFGIIIWPFIGALVGELINKSNSQNALKAAFGSFIGFLAGTLLKFILAVAYLIIFLNTMWDYRDTVFSF
ncbi:MAG: DUF456 domain-containing protein [Bacteroidota bacterium]